MIAIRLSVSSCFCVSPKVAISEHLLELLCLIQFVYEILVNRNLERIGEVQVPRVNLVDLNAPARGGSPVAARGFRSRSLAGQATRKSKHDRHQRDPTSDR